jgi:hypothetical protein
VAATGIVAASAVLGYVALAQSLPLAANLIDPAFFEQLRLSGRIQAAVTSRMSLSRRNNIFEQAVPGDPIFYRRKPGSIHREGSFTPTVDESGYMNADIGRYDKATKIDAFLAGDSVLEGAGRRSFLEPLKSRLPFSIWNLSLASYGPRQKARAVENFALPKKPEVVFIEFYAGNDASEANEDDILEAHNEDYRARFSMSQLEILLALSPKYKDLMVNTPPSWAMLFHDNLTLALTRKIMRDFQLLPDLRYQSDRIVPFKLKDGWKGQGAPAASIAGPAFTHFPVKKEHHDEWIKFGMDNTLRSYSMLLTTLRAMKSAPRLVLLYNPTSYEVYRELLLPRREDWDRQAALQRDTLQSFARREKLRFVDLTPALRGAAHRSRLFLHTTLDPVHWSDAGTAAVSTPLENILIAEARGK